MSEQSRLRLVVLQVLVLSLLATLLGRLWYLQVRRRRELQDGRGRERAPARSSRPLPAA